MKTGVVNVRVVFFSMVAVLFFLITTSGYLYHQNKIYRYQNQRLIVQNDSILSENIELKDALQQKTSAAFKSVKGLSK